MSPVHGEAVVGVVGRGEVGDGAAGQPQGPAHCGHHTGEDPALAVPGTDTGEALLEGQAKMYRYRDSYLIKGVCTFEELILINVLDQVRIQYMKEHNTSESIHTFKSTGVGTGTCKI